jgi:hypothetical protein
LDTVDNLLDTEIATIISNQTTIAGYLDTEIAAIKAKTDLIPASPAATGDIPSAATIAAAVLTEPIDTSEGSATAKCLLWMIAMALNSKAVSGGTLTVKKTDNSTNLFTQTVTTDDTADLITSTGESG